VDGEAEADGKAKPAAKRTTAKRGPTLDADRLLSLDRGIPKLQKMMRTVRFSKSKGAEVGEGSLRLLAGSLRSE
jgi:hypothetical protein